MLFSFFCLWSNSTSEAQSTDIEPAEINLQQNCICNFPSPWQIMRGPIIAKTPPNDIAVRYNIFPCLLFLCVGSSKPRLLYPNEAGVRDFTGCGYTTTPKWGTKPPQTPLLAIFDLWGGFMPLGAGLIHPFWGLGLFPQWVGFIPAFGHRGGITPLRWFCPHFSVIFSPPLVGEGLSLFLGGGDVGALFVNQESQSRKTGCFMSICCAVRTPPPPPCPTNTVSNEHFPFGPYFFGTQLIRHLIKYKISEQRF